MSNDAVEAAINPTPDRESARRAFADFVTRLPRDGHIVGAHDVDADGVSAGVVWWRTMERLGFPHAARFVPDRERNVWTPNNAARIAAARPDALFVMDLGSQSKSVVPDVPTCFIDHHAPKAFPKATRWSAPTPGTRSRPRPC